MNTNRIFEKIKNHKTAYVLSIKSENLDAIEYASKLDYDAIHLDAEHGSFSVDSVERICQLAISAGLTVTARIHKISKQEINLFIDKFSSIINEFSKAFIKEFSSFIDSNSFNSLINCITTYCCLSILVRSLTPGMGFHSDTSLP